ncbi:hypothetical protein MM440_02025 [Arsenicicoccus piscis]|uniref:hypothetical protein n=1 Tax=Arsenicicoccus piscis TaxID=673954 RepID=UPI001F4C9039|nr:hypothetical protein [Arsenicicoccus piscis]MCH8626589.1 hypothetical protein [Arsenicicoccus piscis]
MRLPDATRRPPLRAVLGSLLGTAPLGRLLLLVLVVALALAVGSGPIVGSPPHAVAAPRPSAVATEPVVVIGAGGLRWEQLTPETMPHLWGLLRTGQSADLVVRAADDPTCLADGWLTLGAGDRAAAPRTGGSCAAIPSGGAGTVAGWSTYRAAAAANRQDAVLGSLADTLAARQSCVLAIDPPARLGAATGSGEVPVYARLSDPDLGTRLTQCPLALVDAGSVSDPDDTAGARRVDLAVARVLAAAPAQARIVVAGLADDRTGPALHPVVTRLPGVAPGLLTSSSTRRTGVVLLTDLTPSILAWLGLGSATPAGWSGRPLSVPPEMTGVAGAASDAGAEARRAQLLDVQTRSATVQPLVGWFYGLGAAAFFVVCGVLAARRTRRVRTACAVAFTALASLPVASFLVNLLPWSRSSHPTLTLVAALVGCALAVATVAWAGPWRRHPLTPLITVTAVTAVTLALDVMTGSELMIASLMGDFPVVGGRFYGFGNVAFAVFATAVLLLAAAVIALSRGVGVPGSTGSSAVQSDRGRLRNGLALAAGIGLAGIVVDAHPSFGADLGGPVALLPALVLLLAASAGVRVTLARVLVVGLATAGVVGGVALVDWLRPAQSRTHLGRFVQQLIDGSAWDVVVRKAQQNWELLTSTPLALLVPVALVVLAYGFARPGSLVGRPLAAATAGLPDLRHGLVAVLVMAAIGFVMNDTGTVIPAAAACVAVPVTMTAWLRAAPGTPGSRAPGTPAPPSPTRRPRGDR